MQNLLVPFIFQGECRMKIEHVLFPSVFSKLRIRLMEGNFQCVHTIHFSEPTKIGSLKTDRVNRPLESDCVNQFEMYKRTRGKKMKSDTDSQERQRTVISRSAVEFMTPPPKKIDEYLPACWTCHMLK